MANETEVPVWGDELEDYINFNMDGTAPDFVEVTNLLNWGFGDDETTYEPKYIDSRNGKKYVLGRTVSIDYEKDLYKNNALDAFLVEIEDKTNVPVDIVRVQTWNENKAKMARFLLTPKQLDKNTAGEPVKLKGTLSMSDDDWTYGAFNNGVFVPGDTADAGIDPGNTTPGGEDGGEEDNDVTEG